MLVPKSTECYWDINLILFQGECVVYVGVHVSVCVCVLTRLSVMRYSIIMKWQEEVQRGPILLLMLCAYQRKPGDQRISLAYQPARGRGA